MEKDDEEKNHALLERGENIVRTKHELHLKFKQSVVWWLNRYPSPDDCNFVIGFLRLKNAVRVNEENLIHYRIFGDPSDHNESIHITVGRRGYGISVHAHCDFERHGKYDYNEKTLALMSALYVFLKQVGYGSVVMVPREETTFQGLIGSRSPRLSGKKVDVSKRKMYNHKPRPY